MEKINTIILSKYQIKIFAPTKVIIENVTYQILMRVTVHIQALNIQCEKNAQLSYNFCG